MGQKDLLDFYKKQLDDIQSSDHKYKEKVEKYLEELIEDRHELASENLRKGEKISDLQTALVDLQLSCFDERERFLKVSAENEKLKLNELRLHENIRHLLNLTKEKKLRDRIIYILDDPKVEIGYRYENSKSTDPSSAFKNKWPSDDVLKKQIHQLQSKLDEHSKISQTKTDVILEDCRAALEKSKDKLLQSEGDIKILKKRLQDAEELLRGESKSSTSHRNFERNNDRTEQNKNFDMTYKSSNISNPDLSPAEKFSSTAADMRIFLACLSTVLKQTVGFLSNIQSSQVFIEASKSSKQPSASHKFVDEFDVVQFQNYIRQCTRLSFEANTAFKSLKKIISTGDNTVREFNVKSEIRELESVLEEVAVCTAEADLIAVSLSRASFFDYLISPKQPFVKSGVKESNNLSKYIDDANKIGYHLKMAGDYVSITLKLSEKILENIATSRHQAQSSLNTNRDNQDSSADQQHISTSQEQNQSYSRERLQDAEELLRGESKSSTSHRNFERNNDRTEQNKNFDMTYKSSNISNPDLSPAEKFSSTAADMRLFLASLSTILKKSVGFLSNIQSSQVFIEASKSSKQPSASHKFVTEFDVVQFQNYIRQCTRLSFEANTFFKSLKKIISTGDNTVREFNVKSEIRELESVLEEVAVCTAEADLIAVSLSRASFFDYLISPKQPFVKFGVKESNNLSKYIDDANKIGYYLKMAGDYVSITLKLSEKILENIATSRHQAQSSLNTNRDNHDSSADQQHISASQEQNQSYFRERSAVDEQDDTISKILIKRISKNSVEMYALINKIDKTLSKINQVQRGEYVKDNEFCIYFGEQVKDLSEKLNQLHNEFNIQDIQDKFYEYSSMTLSKLETIAKQSRDSVISAEAQISAHRSHAKNLSRKLKDTEELLRVSISECLSLKQKLLKEKIIRTEEITQLREGLREKLESVADFDELETAVQEVISSTESSQVSPGISTQATRGQQYSSGGGPAQRSSKESQYSSHGVSGPGNRTQTSKGSGGRKATTDPTRSSKESTKRDKTSRDQGGPQRRYNNTDDSSSEAETAVKRVQGSKISQGPFQCMYCRQGSEHKLCDEKIRELRANNRSLKTVLKLLQQEIREEKKVSRFSQDQADRAVHESSSQSENLSRRLESLETRNASLLEQLNLEKNRLKKMEKFRKFEIAGAQTDIKNLKAKIQELENQLVKAVMIFEHDKKDLELLKSVHTTAQNSKQAVEGVKRLKRKLYELETDLKHL